MEVERRAPPEAFVKKQYRIFSIFDLESENFGTIIVEYLGFLHSAGCNKLDNKFNSGTPSCTPQITTCGGQLIRTVYVFSLAAGGGSVQTLIQVQLFETSWSAAHQASPSFTTSRSNIEKILYCFLTKASGETLLSTFI